MVVYGCVWLCMVVYGCVLIKDQQCDPILNHPAKSTLKSTRQQYHEKLTHLGIYVCTIHRRRQQH